MPGPPAPPAKANTLLSAHLECALASFLRGAGASLAHVAGSSIVGLPWDGGAPIKGGELVFSICLGPFDSFVDVIPGGFWGGRRNLGSVGFDYVPRDGGLGGTTILALVLGASSSLFAGLGNAAELGGNKRTLLSPLSFQGEAQGQLKVGGNAGIDLRAILLDSKPRSKPLPKVKMFSLFKYDPRYKSVGFSGLFRAEDDASCWWMYSPQDFYVGLISTGGRFCTKRDCKFQSHHTKAWKGGKMFPGFYVLNAMGQEAYLKPFLLMEVGMRSTTGQAVISKGEQTMETWSAIFCHLRDMGGDVEAE
jgi:hypothetical protein